MKRCVIIGGAAIHDYPAIRQYLKEDDYIICCDSGLSHCTGLQVTPDLIIGDFDSHEKPETETEMIVLPREKDDTDTFYAAKEALRRGYTDYLLLGVIGARLDHSFGNLSILMMLDTSGCHAVIADDYSDMEVVSGKPVQIPDSYPYFSTICLPQRCRGVTIRNAKYPLEEAEISADYQYGISNEVLPGTCAEVSVREGRLLLIRDR